MARANPNTPYGLRRVQRQGSADYRDSLQMFYIPPATAAAMYEGDPVVRVTGSTDDNGVQAIALATAGSGNAITGVIQGFVPQFSTSGSPGPMYKPANAAIAYYALVSVDPADEYDIQENDDFGGVANTPLPVTAVGKNISLVAGAGSPYTGWSGWMADANTVADAAAGQLTILGFPQDPDNTAGALYAKIRVRINNSTETPHTSGV
jgi:hypothetical protein